MAPRTIRRGGILRKALIALALLVIVLVVGAVLFLDSIVKAGIGTAGSHVLGVPTRHADLADDIERWRTLHDDAVAEDDKARHYVRMLETEFDRRAEAELPSGDDLAAEFQKFLDERRNDD